MANANLKFDDSEWRAFFERNKNRDWSKVLQSVYATIGFKDVIDHFNKEEGPEGGWQRRKAETDYRYSKIGGGEWKTPAGFARGAFSSSNKVLQLTGNLRGGILPTNSERVSKTAIKVFNNVVYSGIHDRGGKFMAWGKHSATMPKRSFMWLSNDAMERMAVAIMGLIK